MSPICNPATISDNLDDVGQVPLIYVLKTAIISASSQSAIFISQLLEIIPDQNELT